MTKTSLRYLLFSALLFATALLALRIYSLEQERKQLKTDLIELSKAEYGLFNTDEWKAISITTISEELHN
jgi:hypothetical protein